MIMQTILEENNLSMGVAVFMDLAGSMGAAVPVERLFFFSIVCVVMSVFLFGFGLSKQNESTIPFY